MSFCRKIKLLVEFVLMPVKIVKILAFILALKSMVTGALPFGAIPSII